MKENTLKLVLDFKWFDLIASGQKLEEYREIKPFWERLGKNKYTHVAFQRGYTGVWITLEIESIMQGLPDPNLCNPEMIGKLHWVIKFKPLPCTLKLKHKGDEYEILWETPPSELNTDNHKFMVSIFGDVIEELYGDIFDFLLTNEPPSVEYGTKIIDKFLETYKK